ncbi:MAG: RNA polymerase sigma factor [Kofleriaceae bacterium]
MAARTSEEPLPELVERLRRGEPAALDAAYEQHRAQLYAFLVRMTGQRPLAEDLLQETWIRLARRARELRPDTNLRAYLFTIARNLVRSHQRWASVDSVRLEALAGLEAAAAPATPLELAERRQAQARLEAAIARLPPAAREVVLLVGVAELSPSEAAEVLGERPEATRQRLSRARALLREELTR